MNPGEFEKQIFNHAHRLLKTHETLLRDGVRNYAFYEALRETISDDSVVLDIGAGTGIWAIAAAKLGAKKVVAVDMDELMIGVIRALAAEHRVAGRVEAICASSFDLQLEREFDVIVSETIGYLGYDESIVEVMHDARQRFLKKGGRLIPETVSLYAAAGHLKVRAETVPTGLPFDLAALQRLNLHSPRALKKPRDAALVTKPKCLIETDLYSTSATPPLKNLCASWDLKHADAINCFVVWVESNIANGIRLSTRRTTSWLPTIYRIDPVKDPYSRVDFELSLTATSNYWTVTFSNEDSKEVQAYSPEFAATEMVAARDGVYLTGQHGRLFPTGIDTNDDIKNTIKLCLSGDEDQEFLLELYCTTRCNEVAQFGWDEAQQSAFLKMQYMTRRQAYKMQVPSAENSVILFEGSPAGGIIVDRSGGGISLIDIAVLPDYQGKGIATFLIRQLQKEGADASKPLVLHVDKANPHAFSLYQKLGFTVKGETQLSYEMAWIAAT